MIRTQRMRLIPATPEIARAELRNSDTFARLIDANVPPNWPPEMLADALPWFVQQLEAKPELSSWLSWYGIIEGDAQHPATLAASGGFTGQPQNGAVEVGYSVLPQFYRQGFGSEMIGALVDWAFEQPEVTCVFAEILPTNAASIRLVQKLGFQRAGPGHEPGADRYELRRD